VPIQIPNFENDEEQQEFRNEVATQVGKLNETYALFGANWDAICKIIAAIEVEMMEAILRLPDNDKIHDLRGRINGMRDIRRMRDGIKEQITEKMEILKQLQIKDS
jgi:hypothetical protein